MRFGPRLAIVCLFLYAGLSANAWASSSLTVNVDSNHIALGTPTAVAAHVETDADFHGGQVVLKFRGADTDCAATPDADPGSDATEQPLQVGAGPGVTDVGGSQIQLDVGNWVICGWLVDTTTGAVAAQGETIVQVIPYQGSLSVSVRRVLKTFQIVLAWSTSEEARVYATLQPAAKQCPRYPSSVRKGALLVLPRGGHFVASDGGLGRSVGIDQLEPGHWRICAWIVAPDGRIGPVSRTFVVPRARKPRRHASRVAG
jgi:hypothetical protein